VNKSGCLTFNFDVSSYFTFSLSPKIDNVSPDDGALSDRSSLRATRKSENEGRAGSDNIVRDIKRRNGTDSHTNAVYVSSELTTALYLLRHPSRALLCSLRTLAGQSETIFPVRDYLPCPDAQKTAAGERDSNPER
jgi:hypothetical protein